jgi:hypothetical protein
MLKDIIGKKKKKSKQEHVPSLHKVSYLFGLKGLICHFAQGVPNLSLEGQQEPCPVLGEKIHRRSSSEQQMDTSGLFFTFQTEKPKLSV